jgi:hypothetical protein
MKSRQGTANLYALGGRPARPVRTIASMQADATTWPTAQDENEKPKHTIEGGQAIFKRGEWEHCTILGIVSILTLRRADQ